MSSVRVLVIGWNIARIWLAEAAVRVAVARCKSQLNRAATGSDWYSMTSWMDTAATRHTGSFDHWCIHLSKASRHASVSQRQEACWSPIAKGRSRRHDTPQIPNLAGSCRERFIPQSTIECFFEPFHCTLVTWRNAEPFYIVFSRLVRSRSCYSVASVAVCLSVWTECIVAKRCVLEQKLLLTA